MAQPPRSNHLTRVAAAVAFWAAAVLFVTDVSLLSGWLAEPAGAAAGEPHPSPTAAPPPMGAPTQPAATPTAAQGAETVTLDGGATITFPLPSQRSTSTIDVAGEPTSTEQHAAVDGAGVTYTVGVVEYPDVVDVGDPAVNLLASVSGAAGSAGGRVTEQDVTVYDGVPAVEFEVTTDSVTVLARYVLEDRRLYAASVAFSGTVPTMAQPFLDSLRIADAR